MTFEMTTRTSSWHALLPYGIGLAEIGVDSIDYNELGR